MKIKDLIGIKFEKDITKSEWLELGKEIGKTKGCCLWLAGDWLLYGEKNFNTGYDIAVKLTKYKVYSLITAKKICKKFEIKRRRKNIPFIIHQLLASLNEALQDYWLDFYEKEKPSYKELRELLNQYVPYKKNKIQEKKENEFDIELWTKQIIGNSENADKTLCLLNWWNLCDLLGIDNDSNIETIIDRIKILELTKING
jgi:hypothetical protein